MAAQDVMIDIETLSLNPSALVLSIGAVKFDCKERDNPTFYDTLMVVPDFMEQVMMGRRIDHDTQKWWAAQPAATAKHWRIPNRDHAVDVRGALSCLTDFIREAPRIWANGVCFDITILENLYHQVGHKVPWKYNAVRDARTFYDTNPETRTLLENEQIAHDPIGDCRTQIYRLWRHGWTQ